jgi:hypothetical protein
VDWNEEESPKKRKENKRGERGRERKETKKNGKREERKESPLGMDQAALIIIFWV